MVGFFTGVPRWTLSSLGTFLGELRFERSIQSMKRPRREVVIPRLRERDKNENGQDHKSKADQEPFTTP